MVGGCYDVSGCVADLVAGAPVSSRAEKCQCESRRVVVIEWLLTLGFGR